MNTWLVVTTLLLTGSSVGEDHDRFYQAYFKDAAEGRVAEALTDYRSLWNAFPDDPEFRAWVRIRVASCELRLGNPDRAVEALDDAAGLEGLSDLVKRELAAARAKVRGEAPPAASDLAPELDATQRAVVQGLEWLIGRQQNDGSWSPPTEELSGFRVGLTALALRAVHRSGSLRLARTSPGVHPNLTPRQVAAAIDRSVRFLLAHQERSGDPKVDGRIGRIEDQPLSIYNHALALRSLLEVYRDHEAESLREPLEAAVEFALQFRNPKFGWGYEHRAGNNYTSITAYMAAALEVARELSSAGRISIPRARIDASIAAADTWVRRVTTVMGGTTGYVAPGDPGPSTSGLNPNEAQYRRKPTLTAAGLHVRLMAGTDPTSESIRKGVANLVRGPNLPDYPPSGDYRNVDYVYWDWGAQALRRFGGEPWRTWRRELRRSLIPHQNSPDESQSGSWDPVGLWSPIGGRVMSTALAVTILVEVAAADADESLRKK